MHGLHGCMGCMVAWLHGWHGHIHIRISPKHTGLVLCRCMWAKLFYTDLHIWHILPCSAASICSLSPLGSC